MVEFKWEMSSKGGGLVMAGCRKERKCDRGKSEWEKRRKEEEEEGTGA